MRAPRVRARVVALMAAVVWAGGMTSAASAQSQESVTIRGHRLSLRLYGPRGGTPVVVSSGDGGWIHLAPHVAELLAGRGFFVVGFDVKAYLESFTSDTARLRREDEPGDYKVLVDFASHGTSRKPILIGVSEGAGLSVLAATDAHTKAALAGVIGLGLPDLNELGWRWRDMLIYLTHGMPDEPTFSASSLADRVSPVPLGAIHSTRDEFVPLSEIQQVMSHAKDPKKLWVIEAADHRFSDKLADLDRCLLEAIAWIQRSAK
jgi:dienelactone hydrolase